MVHNGLAWSFSAFLSKYVTVLNSDFVGARAIGFAVKSSSNITIDGIFSGDVMRRPEYSAAGQTDVEACVSICAMKQPDFCYNNTLMNSVAAGCHYAGFVVPGHACGQSATQKSFRNNVAHSV